MAKITTTYEALERIFPRRVAREIEYQIQRNNRSVNTAFQRSLHGLVIPATCLTDVGKVRPNQVAKLEKYLSTLDARLAH